MMNTTVILVLIIVFSFVASRLLKRYAPAYFAFSGAEYLALGVVLGPLVTGFVKAEALTQLEPIIALLLGVVGFTLGLMLREHIGALKYVAPKGLAALVSIALPALGCYMFLVEMPTIEIAEATAAKLAATIGVVACVSSVTRIDAVARLLSADGWVTRNLRSFAVVSDTIAVFGFGIITSALRSEVVSNKPMGSLDTLSWLGASILVGAVCGGLFIGFIGKVRSTPHLFLATIGCVIFASGLATAMGVSPLFVNLIVGGTLALFSSHADTLRETIVRLEHPTLILLLIFAGMVWVPVAQPWMWAFVPLYLVVRFVSLRAGSSLVMPFLGDRPPARNFGNGLLAQGVIAVAIAVDFTLTHTDGASFVLTILLVAMLAQDFLSTRALRRVLADAEELYTDMRLDIDQPEADPAPVVKGGH